VEQFGRYQLEELIGRGSMGEVHRARDRSTGRVVALKRLPSELDETEREQLERRLVAEASRSAALDVPGVVAVYDHGRVGERFYLATNYVVGRDLARLLQEGPLAPERAVRIISRLAAVLDGVHRSGMVHRDVKPANVLVSGEPGAEQVYLVDFGIARAMAGVGSTRMTRGVVGTFAYMAPERFEEVDGDARADGYALACMLYECLSGRQPFPGESQAQQMRAHFDRPPPRPGDVDPALQAFDGVIAKGMAKRPADRYPTAGALARAATAALSGVPEAAVPPSAGALPPTVDPSGPSSRSPRRRRGLLIDSIGTALAVAAATVLGVRAMPTDPEPVDVSLSGSWSLAVDDERDALLVSDSLNSRVLRRDLDSTDVEVVAGKGAPGAAGTLPMSYPTGIAVLPDGGFYVADSISHRVFQVAPDGAARVVIGTGVAGFSGDGGPAAAATLSGPHGLLLEPDGGLLVADTDNHRIRRRAPDGSISTVYGNGSPDDAAGVGGPAATAALRKPEGLSRLPDGTLYITQWTSCFVRQIDRDGILHTVAGTGLPGFSGDGAAAEQAQISGPSGVAVNGAGDVLFADFGNSRVRRIAPDGTIHTVAGTWVRGRSTDGTPAGDAALANPTGVAVDAVGAIYVADYENKRILRIGPDGRTSTILR
jgi:serine/threonine protein kinase, bacterial